MLAAIKVINIFCSVHKDCKLSYAPQQINTVCVNLTDFDVKDVMCEVQIISTFNILSYTLK